jgi:beta-phosphoglucomutase-like phosphatase (HAD superfamily)
LAILGYSSIQAVTDYLDRHSLTTQVGHVSALPAAYPPGHLQPAGFLLEETVRSIGATPEECALITASPASTDTARSLDMPVIGYATTPAVSERLTAGANCLIPSLADLTLRLRARPLPN